MLIAVVLLSGCSAATAPSSAPSEEAQPPATEGAQPPATESAAASDQPHVSAMPDAPTGDVEVNLVADNVRWNADALTAPAGETWKLVLESRDPEFHPHNFTIIDGPEFADRIYQTPQLVGPAVETYEIPGLPAWTDEYICNVLNHQAVMRGTLTVQ